MQYIGWCEVDCSNQKASYIFDTFALFISLHPHILLSLGSCALACILVPSHPHILMFV